MHKQDSGKQRFRIYLANKGSSVVLYIINIFNNFIHISRTIQKYKSVLLLSRILMCTVAQQNRIFCPLLSLVETCRNTATINLAITGSFSDGVTSTDQDLVLICMQVSCQCLVYKSLITVSVPSFSSWPAKRAVCLKKKPKIHSLTGK